MELHFSFLELAFIHLSESAHVHKTVFLPLTIYIRQSLSLFFNDMGSVLLRLIHGFVTREGFCSARGLSLTPKTRTTMKRNNGQMHKLDSFFCLSLKILGNNVRI